MILKPIVKNEWAFFAICDSKQSCPLLTWLGSRPDNQQASLKRLFAIIDKSSKERHGPRLLPKDISHIVDEKHSIYEFIAGRLRLLWFYSQKEKKVIICTNGFVKKNQKTPRKFIEEARRAKISYTQAVHDTKIVILED
jgi:hypothetical protein